MKSLAILLVFLFTVNAYAENLACTTRFTNVQAGKKLHEKICGAIKHRLKDNGMKYRKRPRFCHKFTVEFLSIHKRDKPALKGYCGRIFTKSCYVIKIIDRASHEGLGNLSAYMVFSSTKAIPTIFNLNAGGVGHRTGSLLRGGPGRIVRMNLSCRKTR